MAIVRQGKNLKKRASIRAVIVIIMLTPINVFAQDPPDLDSGWKFTIGVGSLYSPKYLGDDESTVLAIPNIRIAYGDIFFCISRRRCWLQHHKH